MAFSFVKFPYTSAQALPWGVADFIRPARCHLQSNTLQVKGLIVARRKCFLTAAQGFSQPARIRPWERNILRVQNVLSSRDVTRKTHPKASLGLSCVFSIECRGNRFAGLCFPLQGCVSASTRVPDICPCSRGTSEGLTTLWQSRHAEKRSVFPYCGKMPLTRAAGWCWLLGR